MFLPLGDPPPVCMELSNQWSCIKGNLGKYKRKMEGMWFFLCSFQGWLSSPGFFAVRLVNSPVLIYFLKVFSGFCLKLTVLQIFLFCFNISSHVCPVFLSLPFLILFLYLCSFHHVFSVPSLSKLSISLLSGICFQISSLQPVLEERLFILSVLFCDR